jgi:hypothetical protein
MGESDGKEGHDTVQSSAPHVCADPLGDRRRKDAVAVSPTCTPTSYPSPCSAELHDPPGRQRRPVPGLPMATQSRLLAMGEPQHQRITSAIRDRLHHTRPHDTLFTLHTYPPTPTPAPWQLHEPRGHSAFACSVRPLDGHNGPTATALSENAVFCTRREGIC